MKGYLVLTFFLFLSVQVSGPQLKGTFCTIPLGEGDVSCIEFKNDNRFSYRNSGCLGLNSYGEGNFEIIKSKVILTFDDVVVEPNSDVYIENRPPIDENWLNLEFEVLDKEGVSIDHATVAVKDEDIKVYRSTEYIPIPKSTDSTTCFISALGYETLELKIDQLTSKYVKINLGDYRPKLITNKTYTFDRSIFKGKSAKRPDDFSMIYRKVK